MSRKSQTSIEEDHLRENQAGKPLPTHETQAEQTREAQASDEAKDGRTSTRDRMVDIGRAGQQAGRHKD